MTVTVSETTKATGGLTVVTDMTFVAPEQGMPEEELGSCRVAAWTDRSWPTC
jgi:hypothetical protein